MDFKTLVGFLSRYFFELIVGGSKYPTLPARLMWSLEIRMGIFQKKIIKYVEKIVWKSIEHKWFKIKKILSDT